MQLGVTRLPARDRLESVAQATELALEEETVGLAAPPRMVEREYGLPGLDEVEQHGAQALQRVAGVRYQDEVDVPPGPSSSRAAPWRTMAHA